MPSFYLDVEGGSRMKLRLGVLFFASLTLASLATTLKTHVPADPSKDRIPDAVAVSRELLRRN
jgi:hypothetical protein